MVCNTCLYTGCFFETLRYASLFFTMVLQKESLLGGFQATEKFDFWNRKLQLNKLPTKGS